MIFKYPKNSLFIIFLLKNKRICPITKTKKITIPKKKSRVTGNHYTISPKSKNNQEKKKKMFWKVSDVNYTDM